jgi:DNA-binding IclR family transcriptional regulator
MNNTSLIENQSSETEVGGLVPALDRTLDILETLSDADAGMTLSALSQELQLPKNAVFRITQTLLARGYLYRNEKSMAFSVTPKLLRLVSSRGKRPSLSDAAKPHMQELRDLTRETIQLGVMSGREGVIIDQIEGLEPLRIVVDIGLRFLLHCNAPGKMLLAHMPISQRKKVIEEMELTVRTSRTITDRKKLHLECERILDLGYSIDYAEGNEGIHCIAGPIVNPDQSLAGTLWITGPANRLPRSDFVELGKKVKSAGERISRDLMI